MHHHNNCITTTTTTSTTTTNLSDLPSNPELDTIDFEFQLEQPVNILPADQLFSDGKLFSVKSDPPPLINGVSTVTDSFSYSPKTPKCSSSSSKWKELLSLKKLYQNNSSNSSSSSNINGNGNANENGKSAMKSIKHYFLYGTSKPSATECSSVKFPLLNVNVNVTETDNEHEHEPEPEPVMVTSRHSLSSSSSGHETDELPRLSLDSEKKNNNTNTNTKNPRMKVVKTRTMSSDGSTRGGVGVATESPRMNSSGKIVFHSLERSSSSPSSFNGGPRLKHRGVERSYSSNVRITPVLNVPVCSLRGFPLFSSSQKSEGSSNGNGNRGSKNQSEGSSNGNGNGNRGSKNQPMNTKSKIDRS